jgi:predicted O-methyltransferase YrrM
MRSAIRDTLDELELQRLSESNGERGRARTMDERMLAVGPETGLFLNTLARATGAQAVLEVGGSFGYSTIWLAEAVEANGGRVISLENVPAKAERIRQRVTQAGLAGTVTIIEGDALEQLPLLQTPFDLVLIDAWKDDYPAYFDLVFPRLRLGGVIVADNVPYEGGGMPGIDAYVQKARSHPGAQSQPVPLGSGIEVTLRRA